MQKCPLDEPPTVRINIDKENARPGETVTIRCDAQGVPEPSVTLLLPNGQEIVPINNVHVIENVQKKDSGTYTCKASNREGFHDDQGSLLVEQPTDVKIWIRQPNGELRPADPEEVVPENSRVELECRVQGDPMPGYKWI